MNKGFRKSILLLSVLVLAGALGFGLLYHADNKYMAALPGGYGHNVLQDPEQAAFLVDGWEYYPGELLSPAELASRQPEHHTYIGEHLNFSAHLMSPYGAATYRLHLQNHGKPTQLSLYLPELLSAGRIYIDGVLAGEQGSISPYRPHVTDGVYSFTAGSSTEIVVQCANYTHYYSGMTYPPAIGTPTAISRMITARMMVYGILCFGSLAIALSNLALWLFGKEKLNRRLGLLCLAFALRMCYPFLRALGAASIRPLYALEDFCGSAVLLLAILLGGELSGCVIRRYHRGIAVPIAVGFSAASAIFPLFILPYAPIFINAYGYLMFAWQCAAGGYLLFLALQNAWDNSVLSCYLLCAAGIYGLSMILSAVSASRFEPICGAWPEEYGGFALVLGFTALMVHRGVLLAAENRRLTLHLQEEVQRQTRHLETLLRERRELLATLIHDFKNPLTSVRSYAGLVRSGGVSLDAETLGYLDALDERVIAVEERFIQLQDFSRGERGFKQAAAFCLNDFIREFYEDNRPDMELSGHSFRLKLCDKPLMVHGDADRLRSALENLCYNALSFTPEDGRVTLKLTEKDGRAAVTVSDTGAGIPAEDIPRLFDRGFTNRPDGSGEGLGLFIVRAVALEYGGTVDVESRPGEGSAFTLYLPVMDGEPQSE